MNSSKLIMVQSMLSDYLTLTTMKFYLSVFDSYGVMMRQNTVMFKCHARRCRALRSILNMLSALNSLDRSIRKWEKLQSGFYLEGMMLRQQTHAQVPCVWPPGFANKLSYAVSVE